MPTRAALDSMGRDLERRAAKRAEEGEPLTLSGMPRRRARRRGRRSGGTLTSGA